MIEAKIITVLDLLNLGGLVLPEYQRPYKWEDDQVEQLWDDIFESYEGDYKNYFLGSVITVKDNQAIDIIDGQQRLTTLMILFCVLRDVYPKINSGAADPEAVDNETIKISCDSFVCVVVLVFLYFCCCRVFNDHLFYTCIVDNFFEILFKFIIEFDYHIFTLNLFFNAINTII